MNPSPTQPHRGKPDTSQSTPPNTRVPRRQNLADRGGNLAPSAGTGCLGGFLRSPIVIAFIGVLLALLLVTAASAAVGWSFGSAEYSSTATLEAGLYMLDQYNLALSDAADGNLALARQRLEFIYGQDPDFLDVHQQLLNVLIALGPNTESSSGIGLPSVTPTPTEDPRPKEELFSAAQALLAANDWTGAIDTLLSLRKTDPTFHTTEVDGMLYAALRNRGVQNILELGLFEPGLYDFSLAEKFGPLDGQAQNYRLWARLYLWGNAFWMAYPQDAAYYYGQVASLAPNLTDASGISAFSRYWHSLIQWAEQLAAEEDWCGAYEQYLVALAARNDADLQAAANNMQQLCLALTPSPTTPFTVTATLTPTQTLTGFPPSETPGPTATASYTTEPPTAPAPTETPMETPTP